jgi:transposase
MAPGTPGMTPDAREYRRRRAWELKQAGWKQKEIAAALGVTEGAVSQWMSRARAGGPEALRKRSVPGPRCRLGPEERARLPEVLAQGAEAFGFEGDCWTTKRIARVIRGEFGVRYHPAHVSKVVRGLGLSVQVPAVRATQRDEAAIARWKDERWPELKKRPAPRSGRSSG